jgi:hypothetical protein
MGLIGSVDEVMQTADAWEGPLWSVNPPVVLASFNAWENTQMLAEWPQLLAKAGLMCGETPGLASATTAGQVDTWTACQQKLVLKRVNGAQHATDSLETQLGASSIPSVNLMDAAMAFLANASAL